MVTIPVLSKFDLDLRWGHMTQYEASHRCLLTQAGRFAPLACVRALACTPDSHNLLREGFDMNIRVSTERETHVLDEIYRLRHLVYVEQGEYMKPHPDHRIYDEQDGKPKTLVLAARVDDHLVGTIRINVDFDLHRNEHYDFSPHLPVGARAGSGSMLAVHSNWRGALRIPFYLLGVALYHAKRLGMTHLFGTVNPEAWRGFKMLGFEQVAPAQIHDASGLPFIPVLLALDQVTAHMNTFIERQLAWSSLSEYSRIFLATGDPLPDSRKNHEAYCVVGGTLESFGRGGTRTQHSVGDYIGDECLTQRMNSVTVATSPVELLAVPWRRNQTTSVIISRQPSTLVAGPRRTFPLKLGLHRSHRHQQMTA